VPALDAHAPWGIQETLEESPELHLTCANCGAYRVVGREWLDKREGELLPCALCGYTGRLPVGPL
jgi:hypothetical protein